MRSLTLVDPGGPAEGTASLEDKLPPEALELRRRAVALVEVGDIDKGLRLFVDSVSCPGFWDRSAPAFHEMTRDNVSTLGPQLADPLPPYTREGAATLCDCPVLLVDGDRSPDMYRRNARLLADWLPRSQRVTISGASHGMTTTHPQVFNRVLRAFFADVDRRCGT